MSLKKYCISNKKMNPVPDNDYKTIVNECHAVAIMDGSSCFFSRIRDLQHSIVAKSLRPLTLVILRPEMKINMTIAEINCISADGIGMAVGVTISPSITTNGDMGKLISRV
jgi:hypothetical protein